MDYDVNVDNELLKKLINRLNKDLNIDITKDDILSIELDKIKNNYTYEECELLGKYMVELHNQTYIELTDRIKKLCDSLENVFDVDNWIDNYYQKFLGEVATYCELTDYQVYSMSEINDFFPETSEFIEKCDFMDFNKYDEFFMFDVYGVYSMSGSDYYDKLLEDSYEIIECFLDKINYIEDVKNQLKVIGDYEWILDNADVSNAFAEYYKLAPIETIQSNNVYALHRVVRNLYVANDQK